MKKFEVGKSYEIADTSVAYIKVTNRTDTVINFIQFTGEDAPTARSADIEHYESQSTECILTLIGPFTFLVRATDEI